MGQPIALASIKPRPAALQDSAPALDRFADDALRRSDLARSIFSDPLGRKNRIALKRCFANDDERCADGLLRPPAALDPI
jgi:hypothetical protein